MISEDTPDAVIVKKIREGSPKEERDVAAYLLGSFRGMVHSIVIRPGFGSEEDAQDVLNDAVSDLITRMKEGDFVLINTKLSTFFYSIAKNKWLNILRKRSKIITLIDLPETEAKTAGENGLLDEILAKEQAFLVHNALKHLDDACFGLLYRYWIMDMKLVDIADECHLEQS